MSFCFSLLCKFVIIVIVACESLINSGYNNAFRYRRAGLETINQI